MYAYKTLLLIASVQLINVGVSYVFVEGLV